MTMVRSSRFSWFVVALAAVALGAAWGVRSSDDPISPGDVVVPDEVPLTHGHGPAAPAALRRLELRASAEHADGRYHAQVAEGVATAANPERIGPGADATTPTPKGASSWARPSASDWTYALVAA